MNVNLIALSTNEGGCLSLVRSYTKRYGVWKNDQYMMEGTADEIAKRLNIKPRSVYTYATHKKRKAIQEKRNGLIIDRIEGDDY